MKNEFSPVETEDRNADLDGPPPPPPGEGKKASARNLMDSQRSLGAMSGNPQIMTLQGLKMVEQGMQLIATGVPVLRDPLGQIVAFVRQAVPQAMSGGNPLQVPAAQPAQGSPNPMIPPQQAPMMAPPPPPMAGGQPMAMQ